MEYSAGIGPSDSTSTITKLISVSPSLHNNELLHHIKLLLFRPRQLFDGSRQGRTVRVVQRDSAEHYFRVVVLDVAKAAHRDTQRCHSAKPFGRAGPTTRD